MPKEMTHFYLANSAMEKAGPGALKDLIKKNYPLFLAGSVMVDTPLYHISGRQSRRIWQKCYQYHDTDKNSFAPVAEIIKQQKNQYAREEAIAFGLGLLSHICADITFHPFVYFFTGKNNFPAHAYFETILDIYHIECGHISLISLNKLIHDGKLSPLRLAELAAPFFDDSTEALSAALTRHMVLQKAFTLRGTHMSLQLLQKYLGINLKKEIALSYPQNKKTFAKKYFGKSFLYQHPVTGESLFQTVDALEKQYLKKYNALFSVINETMGNISKIIDYLENYNGENLTTGQSGVKTAKMAFFASTAN
jgi:hypothetical protein